MILRKLKIKKLNPISFKSIDHPGMYRFFGESLRDPIPSLCKLLRRSGGHGVIGLPVLL